MTENPLEKFNAICARVLQLTPDHIVDSLSPTTTPSWDSFNALSLVSELEQGFAIHLTQKEVRSVQNIGEIKQLLRARNIAL